MDNFTLFDAQIEELESRLAPSGIIVTNQSDSGFLE